MIRCFFPTPASSPVSGSFHVGWHYQEISGGQVIKSRKTKMDEETVMEKISPVFPSVSGNNDEGDPLSIYCPPGLQLFFFLFLNLLSFFFFF